MERIFNYAIVTAIPDSRRGERVNVGIIVFQPERLDVRFSDLGKLRALTGHDWSTYFEETKDRLAEMFVATLEPAAFKQRVESLEPVIRPSDTGWFSAETTQDYEDRVSEILESLVRRPRAESKKKSSRINTEITREFKRAGALAKPTESIEDHKVVRDYLVAVDEDLRADFALKNGAYHVTATLDLRRDQVHIKEATWKAIVLDRAKAVLPRTTRRLGVYAAAPQAHQFKSHIQLLGEYADDVFNWADHDDRQRYTHAIYQAMDATLGERE